MEECDSCKGTGISPSGRVDDSCHTCGGTGIINSIDDYFDEDPFMDWDDDIDY